MIKKARELSTFLTQKVDSQTPKHCLLCLSPGVHGNLCHGCITDLPAATPGCMICGEELPDTAINKYCGHCLHERPGFNYCRSAFNYAFPVNQIIQRIKYHEQGYWASPLTDAAWSVFEDAFGHLEKAILLPVPMHTSLFRLRRDNHAELIARRLSTRSGFRVDNKLIVKHQPTVRQAQLSGKARRTNLSQAFTLTDITNTPDVPMIVIDDVTTTGTTLSVIAKLIKANTDLDIYGFTLAKKSLIK